MPVGFSRGVAALLPGIRRAGAAVDSRQVSVVGYDDTSHDWMGGILAVTSLPSPEKGDSASLASARVAEFDALVEAAAAACAVPVALMSLAHDGQQRLMATVGLAAASPAPCLSAFWAHTIGADDVFEVSDTTADSRVADISEVSGEPDIRFYAGVAIRRSDGMPVGTLCVLDRQPRALSDTQRELLVHLSTAAARALESRGTQRLEQADPTSVEYAMRSVVDTVPAMLAYWGRDLRCRFANRAYETWFGVKPEALVGRHIQELLGPELFALNKPYIDAALSGQPQTFERVVPGPDGAQRHSLAHYWPDIVEGQVAGFRVLVSDVSALKEAQEGLRREVVQRERANALLQVSNASLSEAQRLGHIGSWTWSVADDATTWSDELHRIFGREPSSSAPSYAEHSALYSAESFARLQEAVQTALTTGQPYKLELEFVRADRSTGWMEAHGEAVRSDTGAVTELRGTAQDITERRALMEDLRQQHELLQVTLRSIGDAVITTNAAAEVTWLNPVAEHMTGWLNDEARGRPIAQVFNIVHQHTRKPSPSPVEICLGQGVPVGLANHTVLVSRTGQEYGIEDSAAPIRNGRGEVLGVVLVFHDVTEHRRLSSEMTYRATHDTLTALINRPEFEARLAQALGNAHEDNSEHALMLIDLDQFKLVNDACGHSAGDELLQQVAKLLHDVVRSRDTLARLGGDEFAVILEHCTVERAQRVAQQVCDRMDEFRFVHAGRRFRVGASIGLVPLDKRWATPAAVLQAADTSCYAAKEAGRNRVHAWFDTDAAMHARTEQTQWASRLERAVDEDRFVLYAQQMVPLRAENRQLHAEVLLRLEDDGGGLTAPGAFLPAAERFHLSSRIDRWVLEHVIAALSAQDDLSAIDLLSVNLSGLSVGDRAFHRQAMSTLSSAGPEICKRLCLEITETAAVTNMTDAALFIREVRELGVRVALDDFGAGASSFGYLKRLTVDFLKIDGQFVRDVNVEPLADTAVRCFVEVAHVVGVKTTAEFIDKPAVLARMKEIGVDYGQGFLLHRPEPLASVLGRLSSVSSSAPA